MSQEFPDRLRPHPQKRFAGAEHIFDLNTVAAQLSAEAHAAQNGHRQQTLLHQAPLTQVLFVFAEGGELADHKANGLVIIQILDGEFQVGTPSGDHALSSGQMFVLQPNVVHNVRATRAGHFLLTVLLQREATTAATT